MPASQPLVCGHDKGVAVGQQSADKCEWIMLAPPNQQRLVCKMEAESEYVHMAYIFMFGADLRAQLVLINKNFASELRRKFIKGPLLVGLADWVWST